jgi:hypothetical protein
MPITSYLHGLRYDPETKRVMGVAYETTCAALRLDGPDDPIREIVAKKIIELTHSGMRDADQLCELALNEISLEIRPPLNVRCNLRPILSAAEIGTGTVRYVW